MYQVMKDCSLDSWPLKKYVVFILSLSLKSFILFELGVSGCLGNPSGKN